MWYMARSPFERMLCLCVDFRMHTLGKLSTISVGMPFSEKAASCQVAYPLYFFFFVMKVYTYRYIFDTGQSSYFKVLIA